MKLTTLNQLSDAILKEAKLYDDSANIFATMYTDTDDKQFQYQYKTKIECAKAIRNTHSLVCQYLHYIESLIPEKEIEILNRIEADKT